MMIDPKKGEIETEIREYAEGYPVRIGVEEGRRVVVVALNESGYNGTYVDLDDLLEWVAEFYWHKAKKIIKEVRERDGGTL